MKQTLIFVILTTLITICAFAQVDTADLEIWGLSKPMTKTKFVDILNEKKMHVCMADIRPLGFKDANVIGMESIYLVTLRSEPKYDFNRSKFENVASQAINRFQRSLELPNSHTLEQQLAFKNHFANQYNDTATENLNFKKAQSFDTTSYLTSIKILSTQNSFSTNDCLAALYYSKVDSIKEKALIAYLSKVKNNEDILRLLPFLLDNDVDLFVANILKNYFKYNTMSLQDWNEYSSDWIRAMNSPSPTVTFFITDILTQQKMPLKYRKEVLQIGSLTLKEILQGQHQDIVFYKQKIYPFLTYITNKDFSTDWREWERYLQSYN